MSVNSGLKATKMKGYEEKRLDKKAMVKFKIKFMTSQTGQHIINITTILPNISISKSNQTMKFGQLM